MINIIKKTCFFYLTPIKTRTEIKLRTTIPFPNSALALTGTLAPIQKNMKRKERYFELVNSIKFLSIIAIFSLGIILLIDLYLIDIPEKFNKGSELGKLVYHLCLAYIGSFIFYFLVVHLKRIKDRYALEPYISKKTQTVVHSGKILIKFLLEASNYNIKSEYPSEEELDIICSKINPKNNVSGWARTNWYQLFSHYHSKSEEAINSIYEKLPFVEPKLIRYLGEIQNNPHYYSAKIMARLTFENDQNLTSMHLYQYLKIIKELENYADKKLMDFQKIKIEVKK